MNMTRAEQVQICSKLTKSVRYHIYQSARHASTVTDSDYKRFDDAK